MNDICIVFSNLEKYDSCKIKISDMCSKYEFISVMDYNKYSRQSKRFSGKESKSKFIMFNGSEFLEKFSGMVDDFGEIFLLDGSKVVIFDDREFLSFSEKVNFVINKYEETLNKVNSIHSIKIPEKYYGKDYVLINVQYMKPSDKILYVFRNPNNEIEYHHEPLNKFYYYYSNESSKSSEIFKNYSELELKFNRKPKNEQYFGTCYEEDLKIELRHTIDYYYNKVETERSYEPLVMYWDIEVFNEMSREFPTPLKALKPINAISYKMSNSNETNVLIFKNEKMDNSKIKKFDNVNVEVFDKESDLLDYFCSEVRTKLPDMLSGWNTSTFDVPYIFNRMNRLGMDYDKISPVNETYVVLDRFFNLNAYGMYFMDQLNLYKKMNSGKQEASHKLSYIAQKVLGKDKVAYEGLLDNVYMTDINKFIEYSFTDTNLLNELETQLKHISQKFELIKVCASTFEKSETTSGLVEPSALLFAKRKGIVCKNRSNRPRREKFSGAYVIPPKRGLYKWVIDLDFKSLYPSIICSYNIGHNTFLAKIDKELAAKYLYDRDSLPNEFDILMNPINNDSKYETITKKDFEKYINDENKILAISGCVFKNHNVELSFMYELLMNFMTARDNYKKKLGKAREDASKIKTKDDSNLEYVEICKNMKQYDTIQVAYKILMNSFYGAIANPYFRLYNLDMAKTITSCGQEVLKYSVTHVSNYLCNGTTEMNKTYLKKFGSLKNKYVIYGDTDSMFVSIGDFLKKK